MNSYLLIKYLHVSCALITLLSFSLRGYWMLIDSQLLQSKAAKSLPHIIDSLLLLTAITLVIMSRQYPTTTAWVSLKIGLLLLYIGLGTFALKRGRTRQIRTLCLLSALITLAAIFSVALLKPAF